MKKIYSNIVAAALLLLFLFLGISHGVDAQAQRSSGFEDPYAIWMEPSTDDFAAIQQQAEAWFEGKDHGRGSGYKQWKRWEYLNQHRLSDNGQLTNWAARNWDAYVESGSSGRVTNGSWYFIAGSDWVNGPSGYNPGIGRVNCIAFHPTNANILWVGLPSGGLWKTENNGGVWTPLCDGLPAIGVSGIAVHPSNANIIYILTGDGDGGDTKSIGVLKSTNGGATWYTTGLSWDVTDGVRGYSLMMDPTNSSELWAVTTDGLYKTSNSGITWTLNKTGSYKDLEFKPGNSNYMYMTSSSNFFRSTDGGANWTTITAGLPTGENRICIGVTPGATGYVYLLCGPDTGAGSFKGVYRSTNSGLTFTTQSTTPNILGYSSTGADDLNQSSYDLAIVVHRSSFWYVMSGGINTWRSSNYGVSWSLMSMWNTPAGDYTHADIHALEINPLNNRLYCGSDGGIFYSDNFGGDWVDISSDLEPMQWYKIAGTPGNSSLIIGGTQDNGVNKYTGSPTITHIYGADGMDCMINYSNNLIMYFSTQDGHLRKSTDGGNTSFAIYPAEGPWVTPYMMHPTNPNILYGGFYGGVWKSTNAGSTWSNTGAGGGGGLVHGVNNVNIIYAANGSSLYRSANGGGSWTNISATLPNYTISGIELDHQDANQVWVTFSGYTAGEKVYKTSNADLGFSATWTNISGSLPNTVVNCIETDNNGPDDAIYIGTDIGVFYRDANLGDWVPFSNWLPVVLVFDLEINEASNVITAGTYGRGLWRSATYTDCQASWFLSGQGASGYSYYQASNYISSSRQFTEGVGQEGIFKAATQITLTTDFNVAGGSEFKAMLGPCGGGIPESEGTPGPVTGTYAGPMPELLNEE